MHPIHDVDVLVLMATTLAGKRRPAALTEIVAAADLIRQFIPNEDQWVAAFQRLSRAGLLVAAEGGYALTPPAQEIMATLPRKCETAERILRIREELGHYQATPDGVTIELADAEVAAAIQAHRAAELLAAKNLPAPNPKPHAPDDKRPGQGQWRKFGATRRRRT